MKRKKVGLALGSGGARGFCHLGILKVLIENNIPIDFISGCSMGALIGGCYCAGASVDEMLKLAPRITQASIMDVNISPRRYGLIKGDRAMRIIHKLVGEKKIEECDLPFVATATDVKNGKLVKFTSGRLVDAIRASISIPVAFHAVTTPDEYLVDGGVLERVPIEELKEMGADVIIAVDALGPPANDFVATAGKAFLSMIERTYLLMDWEGTKEKLKAADIVITPDQGLRSIAVFKDNAYSIAQGEKAALEALPKIREILGIPEPKSETVQVTETNE